MKLPAFLKPGDRIAITCPSGYLPAEAAEKAKETLTDWGFQVIVGATVGHEYHYFSGEDDFRLQELQIFLDDPGVAAVLAGRGGYGLSRIIDRIDFTAFQRHPKWIIGFSDITVLHAHIHACCGMATIHGPMCRGFNDGYPNQPWLTVLQTMLSGDPLHYVAEGDAYNRAGEATGILTGGNLTILAHLCGSASQPDTRGKILFLEDVGEYLYAIDRMLLTLKRAGLLEGLSGLICGSFTELKDTVRPFGATVPELVLEKVAGYDYPVCFGFSAGHIEANYPIMLGREHRLSVTREWAQLRTV